MANSNKDAAVTFLQMSSRGDLSEVYSKFVGPGFKHHNPYFEGSADTLMAAMVENARANPSKILDVKRTIAEGDLVAVHSQVRLKPEDQGGAVVHLFRFEVGRVVELWDVGQEVPEESPNEYGMV